MYSKKSVCWLKSHGGYQHSNKSNKSQQYFFFAEQICAYFNGSMSKGKFPNCLKLANITPVFKKVAHTLKIIIDQ